MIDSEFPDPGSWQTWEGLIEGGLRNDAWKSAGRWALGRLNQHLGDNWPGRAWTKYRIPTFLVWSPAHTIAFAQLLELALRLDLLAGCSGAGKLRRVLRQDPREEQIAHLAIQLELGGLALQHGYGVVFERTRRSEQPLDVEISLQEEAALVETFAILRDERSRVAHEAVDDLFEGIRRIEWRHGLSFRISFPETMTARESETFLAGLEVAAGHRHDMQTTIDIGGVAVEMFPEAHAEGSRLRGPGIGGDLWPRMASLLARKAEQARRSGARWLRLDALQGLWQFTEWSDRPLVEKLSVMLDALGPLLQANPHIHGLVISSGPAMAQGVFENEDVTLGPNRALRRLVDPLRVRETLIVVSNVGPSQSQLFAELYGGEPLWLGWALASYGLPPVKEIFDQLFTPGLG